MSTGVERISAPKEQGVDFSLRSRGCWHLFSKDLNGRQLFGLLGLKGLGFSGVWDASPRSCRLLGFHEGFRILGGVGRIAHAHAHVVSVSLYGFGFEIYDFGTGTIISPVSSPFPS
jgi:hypothetical protein